jgi:hypothetical protein
MARMERSRFQFSVASLLGVVACVAVNIWLFRLGPLLGILGLNISKHVIIAYLCQALGVDRGRSATPGPTPAPASSPREVPVP